MITFTPYASGSTGNLYTVTDGQTTVLLDCGIPWKKVRQLLQFDTSNIEGVLCSHFHGDHSKGLSEAAKAGIEIYASKETFSPLKIAGHRVNEVQADKIFTVGSWHVLPFETIHDVEGSLGFYMVNFKGEAFLYLTDSAYSPVRFNALRVIAIECNFMEGILSDNILRGSIPAIVGHRIRRNHLSLEVLIKLLKSNDLSLCREIHLLHLSNGNSHEKQMIQAVQSAVGIPCYAAQ